MSATNTSSVFQQSQGALILILFALPSSLLILFALVLFFGFIGDQASELAKLIRDIESDCVAFAKESLQAASPAASETQQYTTCDTYFPKVALFYILAIVWCIGAFVATTNLATQAIRSVRTRYWLSALVAASVPIIITAKYWLAGQNGDYFAVKWTPKFSFEFYELPYFVLVLFALVAFILFLFALRNRIEAAKSYDATVKVMFWSAIVVFVAVSVLFAVYPGNLYDAVGSINIIVLFILLIYLFLTGLFLYSRQTGYPVAALFLIYFIAVNVLGSNDNLVSKGANTTPQPAMSGEQQLTAWLKNRKDYAAYEAAGKKYPVYIVASSGGGMYAAMRSAYYLETLQQHCPRFLHHIFAISGVSGGALGALAFAAEQQMRPIDVQSKCDFSAIHSPGMLETPDQRKTTLDKFFERDVVSAIVGGGLFPGMLRRLLPVGIPISLDRATAFRTVLADNWQRAVPASYHKKAVGKSKCSVTGYFTDCNLNNYWQPDGNFPFMVFNATWVEAGKPVALSDLSSRFYAKNDVASPLTDAGDVKLIDGASLSARFPIALPAGILRDVGMTGTMRLVDGGYFDNSGLNTARAIKVAAEEILRKNQLADKVEVQLIYLGEKWGDVFDVLSYYGEIELERSSSGLLVPVPQSGWWLDLSAWMPPGSELGAHGKALFRARDQRGVETLKLIRRLAEIESKDAAAGGNKVVSLEWKPVDPIKKEYLPCREIPLAWYLAPCTRTFLKVKLDSSLIDAQEELTGLQQQLTP